MASCKILMRWCLLQPTALLQSYLKAIVSPTAKLHFTVLVIKGKPSDVNFASGFKDARRNVCAFPFTCYHNIGGICSIKGFISADFRWGYSLLYVFWMASCNKSTYLLYMRTSGFQSLDGGTLMSSMFPYSDLFHFMLISLHS